MKALIAGLALTVAASQSEITAGLHRVAPPPTSAFKGVTIPVLVPSVLPGDESLVPEKGEYRRPGYEVIFARDPRCNEPEHICASGYIEGCPVNVCAAKEATLAHGTAENWVENPIRVAKVRLADGTPAMSYRFRCGPYCFGDAQLHFRRFGAIYRVAYDLSPGTVLAIANRLIRVRQP